MSGNCLIVFGLAALLAWPIWNHQAEASLFRRRAILARLVREESPIRRILWGGYFVRGLQAIVAVAWGVLLLALASRLSAVQWAILAADLALLALVQPWLRAKLGAHVQPDEIGMASRQWPVFAANVALLALAFMLLAFFAGAPDTRALEWMEVARRSFEEASAGTECRWLGGLVGMAAMLERLGWHAAEVLIPGVGRPWLQVLAWLAFLLPAGLLAFAFTHFAFGIFALVERVARPPRPSERRMDLLFVVPVTLLLVSGLLVSRAIEGRCPAGMFECIARPPVALANPCRLDPNDPAKLVTEQGARIDAAAAGEKARSAQRIDEALVPLFADAERRVDSYLDWYFSLAGEYQRLGAWIAGRSAERVAEKLREHLGMDEAFSDRLAKVYESVSEESRGRLAAVSMGVGSEIRERATAHPCWVERLDTRALDRLLERDRFRVSVTATTAAVAGVTTVAVAAYAARAMARPALKAGGQVAGRVVGRRASQLLVPLAACASTGPAAAICALVAGGVAWVATDAALIKIDELRFREQMRAELLASVEETKREISEAMKAQHRAAIETMAAEARAELGGVFVPARDGVGG